MTAGNTNTFLDQYDLYFSLGDELYHALLSADETIDIKADKGTSLVALAKAMVHISAASLTSWAVVTLRYPKKKTNPKSRATSSGIIELRHMARRSGGRRYAPAASM